MASDPHPTPPDKSHRPITREWTEANEERSLAPAAARSALCFERPLAEGPDTYRTCFARDRDRVLHSAAFRRLKAKTQVFVIGKDDYYRTRLSHTLEVTQLARFLSKALGLNEDLAEVLSLVHDIGHPPFGHEGERILNDCTGVRFDHNQHALRIVDVLESPYHDRQGLNLTHVVRRMILKHGGEAGRGAILTPGRYLEAQVADLADSTAYHHHDLEDGLRAGVLTHGMLQELSLWREASADAGKVPSDRTGTKAILNQILKISLFDLIDQSGRGLEEAPGKTADQIAAERLELITHSEERRAQHAELGQFLFRHFYRHQLVLDSTTMAEQAISTIVAHYQQHPDQLPGDYRMRAEQDGLERSVCDYVSGMTDSFAMNEWQRLSGHAPHVSVARANTNATQAPSSAAPTAQARTAQPASSLASLESAAAASISQLEERIGYRFKNISLAVTALTHASARTPSQDPNERLEFLGDSVLGLVVGQELFSRYPDQPEGELSRIKASAVSRHALHKVAEGWQLIELLFLGPGFHRGESVPPSVVADAVEAVLGAVYMDGGLAPAATIVLHEFGPLMHHAADGHRSRNAKSELQSFTQGELGHTPHYHLLGEQGPDHQKEFTVAAVVNGQHVAEAVGRNKRSAEQRAAQQALNILREAVERLKDREAVLSWMDEQVAPRSSSPGADS
ncbi:MAG: dGTPase [Pseudohongiellaceae bacterium]|jgi:dGTPase